MNLDKIVIKGAREHNLKNINLQIPKNKLVVITGLSGSGRTSISKKINKKISQLYGPTLEVSGNDIRKIIKQNKFSNKARTKHMIKYARFAKFITDSKINLIFNIMVLNKKIRSWNRNNIDNYVEIYIKADIHKIIKFKKKATYLKNKKNIVGLDIKAEFPTKPHIIIKNDFDKTLDKLSKELINKIKILI